MSKALTRRTVLAGGLAGLAAGPIFGSGAPFAPSAASLARPAAPPRSATGLKIEDAEGKPLPISTWAGETLVVNLWAPWCLPCRREMPSLARLALRLEGTNVRLLPLAFDWRGAIGVRHFFKEIGVSNLPILVGDGKNLVATLGIELLPTTIIIDGSGNHVATVAGEATWDDEATLDWLRGLG